VRYEVFTVVKIQVKVFWVVMPCSVVVGQENFREPCCIHLHSEMEAASYSETVSYHSTTWHHNPEYLNLYLTYLTSSEFAVGLVCTKAVSDFVGCVDILCCHKFEVAVL